MANLSSGIILIADPFLKDPNFKRTSVFLCDHQPNQGSIGFVLNRKENLLIGDLLPDLEACNFPVFYGGPVQTDTLHFIHQCPQLIADGIEITDGIFWGGNFEQASVALKKQLIQPNEIRFYLGYSGWSEGQLADEITEKSWLITEANRKLVFHTNETQIWPEAIKQIGGEYVQIINYPIDPALN
ncbi:YqgE/AlgH family protein [Limnovirga soli]|jgi:putative transcriptional regulator|uniref:YqgE/AlgH family protein n=1 Tax=Limnovirga soli TaxID=2656915 RepID=A0A8J8FGL4_9BACT|nr:YqgE/AlgH family protein [Limnovirga soli]NNV57042.1 YqgE/AlgH family protein [Limnovirga soli]